MLRMRSLLLAGACLFAASLTQAADNPATPKPALDNKVIRVGTAADYPPLTMQSEGQVRGIEADLAAELGKRTGHHYQFKIIPWSGLFNAAAHPTIKFVSDKFVFKGDNVSEVTGQLTLLGKTAPITLKANQFACYQSPMLKREVCGGDFEATIDRTQWGMNYGVDWGFAKNVRLVVQVEAVKQ